MKKYSDVFKSIRFAKMDPSHEKSHKGGSQDDEEHYTVGEKEWQQQVKHAKKRAMQEEKKDKYDEGEYDREGDMAKSDLRSIIANAQRLHDMIDDADNLPEWVQSKITVAEDYISTVANYMTAEMNEGVSDKLYKSHQDLRKKSGLPHPDYYKALGKSYDIEDDKERLAHQSELKKKYNVKEEVKDEYSRKVIKYLKKKYNKEEVELEEGLQQTLRKVVPGYAKKQINDKMDAEKFGRRDVDKDANYYRYKKIMDKVKKEEVENLEEKNVPTSPEKWAQAKAQAKAKFDVYPSAYANGWAAKKYKAMGGGWKSVSEENISESRKTEIIKNLIKKKTKINDKFEPNPIMSKMVDEKDR